MEHAHWIIYKKPYGSNRYRCSKCEFCFEDDPYFIPAIDIKEFNYCPYCGAKMDEGNKYENL